VLAPDRSHHLEVRVKRSPKFFDVTRVTQFINRTAVLPLCDGWQASVGTHFSSDLTSGELRYLECVLCDYVIKRTAPVPWEELLRRLDSVLTAAGAFQDALTELDPRTSSGCGFGRTCPPPAGTISSQVTFSARSRHFSML
jgi:hypothetical protein